MTDGLKGAAGPARSKVGARGFRGSVLPDFLATPLRYGQVLLAAAAVGLLTGLAATAFQVSAEYLTEGRLLLATLAEGSRVPAWVVSALLSSVMVYVSLLIVRKFAPTAAGSGVQEIEGALDGLRPLPWGRLLPVKFIAGVLSLGSGMVVGREGPTIQLGGSVGKMLSTLFKRSAEVAHPLVAAGAAGGLAAAFNAPLAGTLFVIEEMRAQFKYNFLSVQCVLVAAGIAVIVMRSLLGQGPVFTITEFDTPVLGSLWLFLLFGAVFGMLGVVFNRSLIASLNFFSGLRGWSYALTGVYAGAVIGLLDWFFPDTTGGGYDVIPKALSGAFPVPILIVLFAARFATTLFSYGCGVAGGIFAPMLALGTLFGLWFGHYMHVWFPLLVAHPGVFAVAGMGALFAATVRAPLTGIVLVVEMTANYEMILPLIITCLAATLVAEGLGGQPIYTVLLHRTLAREKG